jgi:hypothetical protein
MYKVVVHYVHSMFTTPYTLPKKVERFSHLTPRPLCAYLKDPPAYESPKGDLSGRVLKLIIKY